MNSENIANSVPTESDEVSLKDLILKIREWWRYLFSKWVIIVGFGVFGGILGFTYAYFKKPSYTATTTFVLEDEKAGSGLGNLAGLASMAGVDLGGNGGNIFQGDNILGLYRSRTMLVKTLLTEVEVDGKKQLLIDRYIIFNRLREQWLDKRSLKDLVFSTNSLNKLKSLRLNRLKDSVLGMVVLDLNKKYLTVTKPDKKLSTIQVDVKSDDEFFAKSFNDELVKNVNEFYINTKTKKSLKNVSILQRKTDSVRAVMNGAIYTAVAIADATPNLNPTRQVQRVAPTQRSQFSAETNKAILTEMLKNLELAKMSLLKETPLIQVIDQPIFPLEKKEFSYLKGFLLGSILFGFMSVIYFLLKNVLSQIVSSK